VPIIPSPQPPSEQPEEPSEEEPSEEEPVDEEPSEEEPPTGPEEPSHLIKIHGLTTVVGATYSTLSLEVAGWDWISVIAIEEGNPEPTLNEIKWGAYSADMPLVCQLYDVSGLDRSPNIIDIRLDHFFSTMYDPNITYTFYIAGLSDDHGTDETEVSAVYTTTYTEVFDEPGGD